MTRKKEIEKRMEELSPEYCETRDEKIINELYELTRELDSRAVNVCVARDVGCYQRSSFGMLPPFSASF
jgi:hypothetical protein